MPGFDLSANVERLNASYLKCDDTVRRSRGVWNDIVADHFVNEYWTEFERTVPDMTEYLKRLNDFLVQMDKDI